ncbi:MAG TPA: DUF4290 domain-containing protein [Bacteroidales bacterium]|nr:DUF4290 domain-containing protein [Bacteroidales bacterium]HPT04113.1 DUF4290 domain-containing protein [Bacteroidales bacterium]
MEYYTQLEKLIIPEYGRNIQMMIEYIVNLPDREKRNRMAHSLVNIMAQLHPEMREVGDVKRKLWDHLYIMSDFKLDVDSPFPAPSPQILLDKPQQLSYPYKDIKFRHYGKNLELLIEKAILMEDGPAKNAFIKVIANHMKKSYLTWNRDSVSDEVIGQHLNFLSEGKLTLSEDIRLNNTLDILARAKKKKFIEKTKENSNSRSHRNWPRKK